MPAHSTEISVQARYKDLPRLMDEIAVWAGGAGVLPDRAHRLQLLVEELFTNTVAHGHGGECGAGIRIALRFADDELVLHYSDEAPPFDTASHPGREAAHNRIGGLGLTLLHGLSKTLRYSRRDMHNVTELHL